MKNEIVYAMTKVYENGLTTTSGGNISVINQERTIYITPGGIDKGTLKEDDIVCVKATGEIIGKHKPSVEFPFHKNIYQVRPEFNAIIHAHPKAIVAISAARMNPKTHLIKSVEKLIPKTSIAPYALPGSQTLGENIAEEFAKGYDIILLENHGVVIGAKDLKTAYLILETLEFYVSTEISALSLNSSFVENDELKCRYAPQYVEYQAGDDLSEYKTKMVEFIKRAHRQKLFTSYFGCFSWRVNENDFLITPRNIDTLSIKEEDLVFIRNGKIESGKEVNEFYLLHDEIYRAHPEINSLAIATPPHVMAFAITEKEFDSRIIPEGYILLKQVQKLKPNAYEEIVTTISKEKPVLLIENNFVIVAGANLPQTFDRLEVLEFGASSLIMAFHYGRIVNISDEEIAKIDNHFNVW